MNITPDQNIVWESGLFKINNTILFTWIIIAIILLLVAILRLVLSSDKYTTKLQNIFEILCELIQDQILKMGKCNMKYVFPFVATLFIFILFCNLLQIIPFMQSPTASLSTTVALVISVVLFGVVYGMLNNGFINYFKKYIRPTPIMLPMNIISDVSSNCALAIRLYGNIMSGMIITAVVSKIVFLAFGFPIFLNILTLITGTIQAYIFSVLALVFINSSNS